MSKLEEIRLNKPHLLRVAQEIAAYKNPERIANALMSMLEACAEAEPSTSLPIPEGQTNNERFNALLNGCQHPRVVYTALYAFAVDKADHGMTIVQE